MRATVIKDDNTVTIDGTTFAVDCSDLPADFHALQWDGARGEVEYRMVDCAHCGARSKKPNATILDFAPYVIYANRWNAARDAYVKAETLRIAAEKAKADVAGQ